MSFDQDPSEQARISASDFEQMCDEMKALKESNADLLDTLQRCEMWLSTAPEARKMQLSCQAAITRATRKEPA